ncbi:MAG TPA: SigE family RNA polymerase sigma factor [Acidimicrobiia bacterium]|nr:SigE family RNA polymerase sigma factor [Acidimicrobiia bacterium]
MELLGRPGRLEAVHAVVVAPLEARTEVMLDGLYRRHAPAALRFAIMLTGERMLAEDLVQDAFVRVAAKVHTLRDPDAFGAYLTRAVANLAKSHFRHREVVKRHDRAVDATSLVENPVDIAAHDELLVALRRLPMQQRAVIVLRFYNDCTLDEIAETLDIPVGTVKSCLSRALARLRKEQIDA